MAVYKTRLLDLCEGYFARCDEQGKHYSRPGLMVALGADEETWKKWRRQKGLRSVLDLAMARIRDDLEQRDDKMALSLIGKAPYGGEEETSGTLRVVFGDGGSVEDYGG